MYMLIHATDGGSRRTTGETIVKIRGMGVEMGGTFAIHAIVQRTIIDSRPGPTPIHLMCTLRNCSMYST